MKKPFAALPALLLTFALACLLWALPAAADAGDYDQIDDYVITVDLRQDGSADITYAIDWQVIGGGSGDYLSWVEIGLANSHVDEVENLTPDTVDDLTVESRSGGAWMRVDLTDAYYVGDSVQFSFRVHQSYLFTRNDDGTASFAFTPGWFDDLNVQHMEIRWRAYEGFTADNTAMDNAWLVWEYGPLAHGERKTVHVTVPVLTADAYDADLAADAEPAYPEPGGYYEDGWDPVDRVLTMVLLTVFVCAVFTLIPLLITVSRRPRWRGGFGSLEPDDWDWYSNGRFVIHRARGVAPPAGYKPTAPPADAKARLKAAQVTGGRTGSSFKSGGGSFRGGGAGRRGGGGGSSCACVSSCACACASSCACACACAGGGRAGCSAKNFYRIKLPKMQ